MHLVGVMHEWMIDQIQIILGSLDELLQRSLLQTGLGPKGQCPTKDHHCFLDMSITDNVASFIQKNQSTILLIDKIRNMDKSSLPFFRSGCSPSLNLA